MNFPYYNATHINQTASACLKMILEYYGKRYTLKTLNRMLLSGKENGVSILKIVEASEQLGLNTMCTKANYDEMIKGLPVPLILLWENHYYVVVYKVYKNKILIADPILGLKTYSRNFFLGRWINSYKETQFSRVVLLFEPNALFDSSMDERFIEPEYFHENSLIVIEQIRAKEEKRSELRNMLINCGQNSPLASELTKTSIHMLLGKRHLEMAICTCKTLNLAANSSFSFQFHDDGSLTKNDINRLRTFFPGSYIIERSLADLRAEKLLENYPRCLEIRNSHILMPKIFDFALWSNKRRIANIDSDIVFFRDPDQLVQELMTLSHNIFNRDFADGYVDGLEVLNRIFDTQITSKVNSGLWVVNRDIINFNLLEIWLSNIECEKYKSHYFLEQTLMAALVSKDPKNLIFFDENYDVGNMKLNNAVCKHYVSANRDAYELEGLSYLIDNLSFIKRWENFSGQI